jgi:hypothetical protein
LFRSLIALSLLLLGLVTPARAQDGAPTDEASAEARRVEHARQFAIGMSTWPTELYCSGPMSAAMQQVPPQEVLRRVQLASRCGVRLVLVPPPPDAHLRRSARRQVLGRRGNRVIDDFARELPPDTLAKYRSTLLGFNLADDYGCLKCWGGKAITQGEIADWAGYARQKLPGLPWACGWCPSGWPATLNSRRCSTTPGPSITRGRATRRPTLTTRRPPPRSSASGW